MLAIEEIAVHVPTLESLQGPLYPAVSSPADPFSFGRLSDLSWGITGVVGEHRVSPLVAIVETVAPSTSVLRRTVEGDRCRLFPAQLSSGQDGGPETLLSLLLADTPFPHHRPDQYSK